MLTRGVHQGCATPSKCMHPGKDYFTHINNTTRFPYKESKQSACGVIIHKLSPGCQGLRSAAKLASPAQGGQRVALLHFGAGHGAQLVEGLPRGVQQPPHINKPGPHRFPQPGPTCTAHGHRWPPTSLPFWLVQIKSLGVEQVLERWCSSAL